MTPANKTKLRKAAREFEAATTLKTAQDQLLAIYDALQLVHHVCVDLVFRPEVNE